MMTLYVAVGAMAIALCALFATYWLWVPFLLRVFAEHDFFITSIKEGEGEWIMKFGKAWRFVTSSRETDPIPDPDPILNWRIPETLQDPSDPTRNIPAKRSPDAVLESAVGSESRFADWIDRKLPGGLRWVGLPFIYSVYRYNFRWDVLRQSKPKTSEDGCVEVVNLENDKWVISFAKRLNYIFLRDAVYYFEIIGAETKGITTAGDDQTARASMPVNIYMTATIRVVNPYQALFIVHDWLETSFDLVRPNIRSWIAGTPYEDVVGKPEVAQREYDRFLQDVPDVTGQIPAITSNQDKPKSIGDYIECTYGVRIKRIAFDDVIPPDAYTQATVERTSAQQQKQTIRTRAEAERDRQAITAEGEANRIKTVTAALAAGGDLAVELRRLEALESVGNNGNMVIVSGKGAKMLINPKPPKP